MVLSVFGDLSEGFYEVCEGFDTVCRSGFRIGGDFQRVKARVRDDFRSFSRLMVG